MMDTICIVPENPEVLCLRLQCSKPLYNSIAVNNAARIRVHRHTPDSLNGVIFCNELFHKIHIRTICKHRYIDHFNAQEFTNCKVTVITRYRTQELYFVIFSPWLAAQHAVGHSKGNCPVHCIQRRISEYNQFFCRNAQHWCQQRLCFRDTIQNTVIAAVQTVFSPIIIFLQNFHHALCQFQLLWSRLSTGHIQLQLFCLISGICSLTVSLKLLQSFL